MEYSVFFKQTPNIFGHHKPYANLLYELSILAAFSGPESYIKDDLTGATIVAIFLDFYNQHNQNICFYICDFSDEKQHLRSRKFDTWVRDFSHGAFFKLDAFFKDFNGETIPASIIMVNNNPYKHEMVIAFTDMLSELQQ